jgi:hypothetical protein
MRDWVKKTWFPQLALRASKHGLFLTGTGEAAPSKLWQHGEVSGVHSIAWQLVCRTRLPGWPCPRSTLGATAAGGRRKKQPAGARMALPPQHAWRDGGRRPPKKTARRGQDGPAPAARLARRRQEAAEKNSPQGPGWPCGREKSGGDRIRTCDLEVMSLASYRAAPPRDMYCLAARDCGCLLGD